MAKKSVNNDPLLERLMFAYDGTNYRVVKCDTGGNVVAAMLADQNVQARGYGWIGAAWQKQPLLDGYSGQIVGAYANNNAAAGANQLAGGDVPAGEVWRLKLVEASNENTASSIVALWLSAGGSTLVLKESTTLALDRWLVWEGDVPMIEGDNLIGYFDGCTLNDNIRLRYVAVRVDIDQ